MRKRTFPSLLQFGCFFLLFLCSDVFAEGLKKTVQLQKKSISIDGEERAEVQRFRELYLNSPKNQQLLHDSLENSINYRLYVRKCISEQKLPPELEYLPIVESNYKVYAKSRTGAIGLWQFMENSVSPFLVLNDYIDERYDPWKSTDAALKKLTENYNYYNDWALAIGAYNCGIGAMNKALNKSPVKDFWYLAENQLIPKQTADYVPKLLAIADLAINAGYYNLDLPSHAEEYKVLYNERNGLFDYITVNQAYSIEQLAQSMRIEPTILKDLNPSFKLGYTHPSHESVIRLPLGTSPSAKKALEKLTPIEIPSKYKVVAGDSLWSIAKKHNTTVKILCELNNINENDILRIGKILYIPSK
ncbi:MAG: transglycosylase SLT domain-containing protein [Treponema sp.]|nr:transglycosylase SLT domain-containing protein [Treponema sp.]